MDRNNVVSSIFSDNLADILEGQDVLISISGTVLCMNRERETITLNVTNCKDTVTIAREFKDPVYDAYNPKKVERYSVKLFTENPDALPIVFDVQKFVQFVSLEPLYIVLATVDMRESIHTPFDLSGCTVGHLFICRETIRGPPIDLAWNQIQCKTERLTLGTNRFIVSDNNCFPDVKRFTLNVSRAMLPEDTKSLPRSAFPNLRVIEFNTQCPIVHPRVRQYVINQTRALFMPLSCEEHQDQTYNGCIRFIDRHVDGDVKDIRIKCPGDIRRSPGLVDLTMSTTHRTLILRPPRFRGDMSTFPDVLDAYANRYHPEIAILIDNIGINLASIVWSLIVPPKDFNYRTNIF